jgi:hypothetical protein
MQLLELDKLFRAENKGKFIVIDLFISPNYFQLENQKF